jgi:hypothetical protein
MNGISLEQSIPKVVNMFDENSEDAICAAIVFPAEFDNDGERESVIMVMAQEYDKKEYLTISLPYTLKNGKIKVSEFELIDYSPFLLEKLPELEKSFIHGLLSYGDATEIWCKK